MLDHAETKEHSKSTVAPNELKHLSEHTLNLSDPKDNRTIASTQRKLVQMANNSERVAQLHALTAATKNKTNTENSTQLQSLSHKKRANNTGLPDNLKNGIETLSGIAMDDVKVYRNSSKPAQLQAHAYAQGTEIHLSPGQEKHLPHEAWHVVQQKQGRVTPTRQLKSKTVINDDPVLEKEADHMGAKAIQLMQGKQKTNESDSSLNNQPLEISQPAQRVVQRYTVKDNHRIANDHTAAVKIEKNNKLLYATQERINHANQVMTAKRMPLSLTAGAQKNGLVDDKNLLTVTPKFKLQSSNQLPPEVTPKDDVTHNVLLPAECEKGAISIIGAFTQTKKSDTNTMVYEEQHHYQARIGELLAKSNAGGGTKTGWFNSWVTLENGVKEATSAWNKKTYPKAEIDQMFLDLNDAQLKSEFTSNFKLSDDPTKYQSKYIINSDTKERALFEKIIRRFDKKMTDIETEIMKTVETGNVNEKAELVTAANLRDQLIGFFTNLNYNKAAIDSAINLVPEKNQLLLLLQEGFRANNAGDKYEATSYFSKDSNLAKMAQKVLEAIDKHVVSLTARNTKSLQNNSGLNTEVNPDIGQSYGIIGGQYNFTDAGRWNWHWASVIIKTNGDNVTMEAHASHKVGKETHNEKWDFKMYGTAVNSGQTFHDQWKGDEFGNAPVTVLGVARDNPYYHTLANQRSITGLTEQQVSNALVCENNLYMFLTPLMEKSKTKQELINDYQLGLPNLDNLPAHYRQNYLNADLALLDTAMNKLINNIGDEPEQLQSKDDAHKYAEKLRKESNLFRMVATHYEGHKKKTGEFA